MIGLGSSTYTLIVRSRNTPLQTAPSVGVVIPKTWEDIESMDKAALHRVIEAIVERDENTISYGDLEEKQDVVCGMTDIRCGRYDSD